MWVRGAEQMGTPLDAAQAELDEAGEEQRESGRLIAIEQKKLDDMAAAGDMATWRFERWLKNAGQPQPSRSPDLARSLTVAIDRCDAPWHVAA